MRYVLLLLLLTLPSCTIAPRDAAIIDRSFLHTFPDHPTDQDLAGHYEQLRYLASGGDRQAVIAILRYFSSDHQIHHVATSSCPFESTEDLAIAAFDPGLDGIFWTSLPQFTPTRQARLIAHYSYLHDREDSGGSSLYSMVDFDGDRDTYLTNHPPAAAAMRKFETERTPPTAPSSK